MELGIDLYVKSQNLLEMLANSIYDRERSQTPFSFNISEVQLTEKWLLNFIEEIKTDCVCL